MKQLTTFISGLLFGLGLILSGMTNPAKVQAFLDLAGNWDPSLALVMGGAIAVAMIAFTLARKRTHTLLGDALKLPTATDLDKRLIIGALLFGAGWGLAGFCPGPALVAVAMAETKAVVFLIAMLAGMGLFELLNHRRP